MRLQQGEVVKDVMGACCERGAACIKKKASRGKLT